MANTRRQRVERVRVELKLTPKVVEALDACSEFWAQDRGVVVSRLILQHAAYLRRRERREKLDRLLTRID